jgi:AcrR family transcriptional regulator
MAVARPEKRQQRSPLTRERVLKAAVRLADHEGIEAVSMRRLGTELGIEAMSLYTHVRDKDDLLRGMVELVIREIPIHRDGSDWKAALRATVLGARRVVLRHPWAPRIIESRDDPGPSGLRYYDGVMGISLEMTHHAIHLLGSRMLGFTQDLFDDSPDVDPAALTAMAAALAESHPYVSEMAVGVTHDGGLGGCDDDVEFAFGLDLILDGLERLRTPA